MPISTNLNNNKYFDDYSPEKDYYRILFKPTETVQTRELNQIQSLSQAQVERFADNIFKRGTIVDGCNFTFHTNYPYVKILDSDLDGVSTDVGLLVGKKVRNSANLQAYIMNSTDGFEATDPDLKTLYVNYTNSGNTGNLESFSAGDTLTAYDPKNGVYSVNVVVGSSGFSNQDTVIVTSPVLVSIDSGSIANGDYISTSSGANVKVLVADEDTYNFANQVLLYLAPRNEDLANAEVNATAWTIKVSDEISNAANTLSAIVVQQFGEGLSAGIRTNGIGKITDIPVFEIGSGYIYPPTISVRSPDNSSGLSSVNLVAKNYYSKFKVASVTGSVGSGYAFSVGEGIIYQQGYMLRVSPQIVLVDKYSTSPNNVVVGFTTSESIVTADEDESLFDNSLGFPNENAPGADRLSLVPKLTVLSSSVARANTDFSILVEWSEGQAFRQSQSTQYSKIGAEMAQRTFDESGNYLIDTFQVTTQSANLDAESTKYTCVVDPGQAYISGYRVQTLRNYYIDVDKGLDTKTTNNAISVNYGNYVRLKEVAGVFQFSTGDKVDLYSSSKQYLSNSSLVLTGNTTPQGTKIGTARCRSMVLENGIPGDPDTVYRLYLFNVKMNPGRSFSNVKSVYYNGADNKGIADVVLKSTNSGNVAVLNDPDDNTLVFSAGVESLKNSANSTYIYRTIDQTTNFANSGILTKSIASLTNEFYPYNGSLSDAQMKELYVVPTADSLYQYSNLSGTVSVSSTSANVTGSGTDFFSDFAIGDYVNIFANATANTIKKVVSITNSTYLTVDSNLSFTNASCNFKRVFPQNVPIPFGTREGLSANVDANNNILKLTLAHSNGDALTLQGSVSVNTAIAVNIQRTNVTSSSKTANRKQFVKFCLANNEGGVEGPWCIGVADALRLRAVYVGNSTVNTSSTVATAAFYIDTNQKSNYLDLSYLMKNPRKTYSLSNTDYILVEFDYLSRNDEGYFDTVSYLGTSNSEQIAEVDLTSFSNLSTVTTSYEVPECYSDDGNYYDLLKCIDFRPAAESTVTPTTNAETAPVNPSSNLSFGNTSDTSNDKKFPYPDTTFQSSITQYLGRVDSVFISGNTGEIYVLKGIPDSDPRKRYPANQPKETLLLQQISVPAYPNVTDHISPNVLDLTTTGIANEKFAGTRWKAHLIDVILSSYEFQLSQPMVYTMEDIANLERRIKDLEYYQSLSILETSITNKVIPSSIDSTLNRFKFGFTADDFSTQNYADISNPQYAASYETEGTQPWGITKSPLSTDKNWANSDNVDPNNPKLSLSGLPQKATNRITPPKLIWSLNHDIQNLPYIDEQIIQQPYATNNAPNTTPDECVPVVKNVNVAATNGYFFTSYNNITSVNKNLPPSAIVTFGKKSGTVSLYFDNGKTPTKYDIFLGSNVIASTNASANIVTALTAQDKALLQSSGNKTGFNLSSDITDFSRTGDYVKDVGKLQFSYDASKGQEYTIVANSTSSLNYKYLVEYPLTEASSVDTTVDPCVIINTITNINAAPVIVPYVGTITIKSAWDNWSCAKRFAINGFQCGDIGMLVTGLKPMTAHRFYLDGTDYTGWCTSVPLEKTTDFGISIRGEKQKGKKIDFTVSTAIVKADGMQPLVSDESGKLYVVFFIPYRWQPIPQPKPPAPPKQFIAVNAWGITRAATLNAWNVPFATQQIIQRNTSGAAFIDAVVRNRNQTSWGSSGYSTLMVSAPNSVATKLIAQRSMTSTIPPTPAGNP